MGLYFASTSVSSVAVATSARTLSHRVPVKWGYTCPVVFTASWHQWKCFLAQKSRHRCEGQRGPCGTKLGFHSPRGRLLSRLTPASHLQQPLGSSPHFASFDSTTTSLSPPRPCGSLSPLLSLSSSCCSGPTFPVGCFHSDPITISLPLAWLTPNKRASYGDRRATLSWLQRDQGESSTSRDSGLRGSAICDSLMLLGPPTFAFPPLSFGSVFCNQSIGRKQE